MKQEESSALDHKNSPYDSLTGLYHLDTFKTNMKQYLKEQDSESHLALLRTSHTLKESIIYMEEAWQTACFLNYPGRYHRSISGCVCTAAVWRIILLC